MTILFYQIKVYLPYCHSLKEKRGVIKGFQSRLRKQFNISIAEIDLQDYWQSAVFGITSIGNQKRHMDECSSKIKLFIEENYPDIQILDEHIEYL